MLYLCKWSCPPSRIWDHFKSSSVYKVTDEHIECKEVCILYIFMHFIWHWKELFCVPGLCCLLSIVLGFILLEYLFLHLMTVEVAPGFYFHCAEEINDKKPLFWVLSGFWIINNGPDYYFVNKH